MNLYEPTHEPPTTLEKTSTQLNHDTKTSKKFLPHDDHRQVQTLPEPSWISLDAMQLQEHTSDGGDLPQKNGLQTLKKYTEYQLTSELSDRSPGWNVVDPFWIQQVQGSTADFHPRLVYFQPFSVSSWSHFSSKFTTVSGNQSIQYHCTPMEKQDNP